MNHKIPLRPSILHGAHCVDALGHIGQDRRDLQGFFRGFILSILLMLTVCRF
jgi:hypothetical protein